MYKKSGCKYCKLSGAAICQAHPLTPYATVSKELPCKNISGIKYIDCIRCSRVGVASTLHFYFVLCFGFTRHSFKMTWVSRTKLLSMLEVRGLIQLVFSVWRMASHLEGVE